MTKVKKYDKYKASNIDFIGDVPSHWNIKKLKYVCLKTYIGWTPPTTKSDYFKGENTWLTIRDMKGKYLSSSATNLSNQAILDTNMKIIRKGSLLFSFKLSVGKVAFANKDLFSNEAILAIESDENINLNYLYYILPIFVVENAKINIYGSRILNQDLMNNATLILPPLKEQKILADFLDIKSNILEDFIADKRNQITLLDEQKETVINKAITKGLDATVTLKDSGIEWIGGIPQHWEAKKLKHCAKVVLGKMLCNTDKGNYQLKPYLKSKNIQWMKINTKSVEEMWFSEYEMSLYKLNKDDLVLSEGGEVGKTSLWDDEIEECYIQNSVHKVTVNDDNLPKYYLYLFFLYGKVGYFNSIVNKVSIAHLTKDKLENLECIVAPKDEQEKIIRHIEIEISKIDEVVIQIQQEINLIEEYKISLISEVVTGQVDVR